MCLEEGWEPGDLCVPRRWEGWKEAGREWLACLSAGQPPAGEQVTVSGKLQTISTVVCEC